MNHRMIYKSIGSVLCVEAGCMVPSLLVALIYGQDDASAFVWSILIITAVGLGLRLIKVKSANIYPRDGFAIVALGWLLVSAFGTLPFLLSGSIPHVADAIFESVSGFSTTGSTILKDIEALPRGILFWRSFTHWMGGMGVLILMIAVLPSVKANTVHIMRAETPGPSPGKIVPKIGETAKIMYCIYAVLTVFEVIFLLMGGMSLYDALIHAFSTAGTGGFSSKNASVAAYNNLYLETVITVFTLLFGVNFMLLYMVFRKNIKAVLKDEELRFYLGAFAAATALITINIHGNVYQTIGEALRYSTFQVSTIMTSTGFVTADYNYWPGFSQLILLFLMIIGACAGSTGGGLKCIRILLLFKIIRREITKIIHPRAVQTVKINGRVVDEDILTSVMTYFFFAIAISGAAILAVSLEGKDILTTATSVISAVNNVGPGMGAVGPVGNFADFSDFSKIILSFCMIIGRLEIYPIMLLCFPSFWKRINI